MLAFTVFFTSCKPKDADVQTKIENKLKENANASMVMVTVNDGVATLSGEVKDEATKTAVAAAAKDAGAKTVVNNTTVAMPDAPVVIAQDDPLSASLRDATKDYPTVNATVAAGVVTLTGEIEKSKMKDLMMAINGLHTKSITNNLVQK